MSILRDVIKIIEIESPRHAEKVMAHIESTDVKFHSLASRFLRQYEVLLQQQGKTLEYGIHSYLNMCQRMLAEQIAFSRSGKYSCSNFDEVRQRVYANPKLMDSYLHGLLLSQILWRSHYQVLQFFIESITRVAQSTKSYLEVGPGHGLYVSEALQILPPSAKVIAIDISPTSLAMAEALVSNSRVTYVCDNFLSHSFDRQFDFITMGEVIEHVEQPLLLLNRLRECLCPGGFAFISAPANAPAIDHIYLFNNALEIRQHIESAGLEVIDEIACCTENVDMRIAIAQKLPIMYAALARLPKS